MGFKYRHKSRESRFFYYKRVYPGNLPIPGHVVRADGPFFLTFINKLILREVGPLRGMLLPPTFLPPYKSLHRYTNPPSRQTP